MDNAKNITKAWMLLNRQAVNCFAHTINLAVKKGLAVDNNIALGRAKKLESFFHHSPLQTSALKNKQALLGMPKKLKTDVEKKVEFHL